VIRFSARFGGVSHSVSVPVSAVLAIYARETGQGMALPEEIAPADDGGEGDNPSRYVDADAGPVLLSAVPDQPSDGDDGDDGPAHPTPRRGGHLRVVK